MHKISFIQIENFRACKKVALTLHDTTPLVGQNNAGKSTILDAIQWLLKRGTLSVTDFNDPSKPASVIAKIDGITKEIINLLPAGNHQTAITPYCPNGTLWIKVSAKGTTARDVALEVWKDAEQNSSSIPDKWIKAPTGLHQALSAILPEPLVIQAMKDVEKDLTSVAAGTSIRRLIEEIAQPVTAQNQTEIASALQTINKILGGDEHSKSPAIKEFDEEASLVLRELFPGLTVKLKLPEVQAKDLFKSGNLDVFEEGRTEKTNFDQLGSGAQRAIEMALIRYLAKAPKDPHSTSARKLLLLDEPELYLHPRGIKRLRESLFELSKKGFQILFSTHSPIMLNRENATHTVIVKKSHQEGVTTIQPLKSAVESAISEAESQANLLFQLGNLAEIYFADYVVLCEGITETRLLPLIFRQLYGKSSIVDRFAFVGVNGSSNIFKSMKVLRSMGIKNFAVADLDFAFISAPKSDDSLIQKDHHIRQAAPAIFRRLQKTTPQMALEKSGFPSNNKVSGFTAEDAWAVFAKDSEAEPLAEIAHQELKKQNIWIWKKGAIEDVLGTKHKGEEEIINQEAKIATMPEHTIRSQFPDIADLLQWLKETANL